MDKLTDSDLKALLERVEKEIMNRGLTLPARGKRQGNLYRNPENQWETWPGLGRRPQWLKDYIEKGGNIEDLRC